MGVTIRKTPSTGDIRQAITGMLREAGIESAALESSLLIAEAGGEPSSALALAEKRASGIPLAYILGRREFMSLDFEVNEQVLIPRPETEFVVETAERYAASMGRPVTYLDIGAGSGNICVSLLARNGGARAVAVDIDGDALSVAGRNAAAHGVSGRCRFVCGDALSCLNTSFRADIVVTNPPYIAGDELGSLPVDVREHEPRAALYGGEDGLDFFRKLAVSVPNHMSDGGMLITEVGWKQAEEVSRIMKNNGMVFEEVVQDLAGIDRVVVMKTGDGG